MSKMSEPYARPQAAELARRLAEARAEPAGMAAFQAAFRPQRLLLVGGDGVPLGEFLSRPLEEWLRS